MLRAFSRTTFGLSECHKDIRVQVAYYTEDNRKQFINFIVGDFNQYVSGMVLVGEKSRTCYTLLIILSKYKSIK